MATSTETSLSVLLSGGGGLVGMGLGVCGTGVGSGSVMGGSVSGGSGIVVGLGTGVGSRPMTC